MNDHFVLNSKNPIVDHFWPIFPIIWAKTFFHEIELLCKTSQGFLAPCQNSEKSNDPISRKHPNRCQEARINRPYFTGTTSKTAVNWPLKVKDIEYNVGLTKRYCITVSI